MAFKLTPPRFKAEVKRRLLDVNGVQELSGLTHRDSVWRRVKAGTLPPPIVTVDRSYALWDKDEIEDFTPTNGKK